MMSSLAHIRRHWAVFLGLVVALIIWCAVDVSRRARIDPSRPGLHMTDITVYTEAGLAFFDGREPYEVANIRGWKYLYPPLFALLMAPLGHVAPQWQAAAWFAVSALMAFGIYFECRRLLMWAGVGNDSWADHNRRRAEIWIVVAAGTAAVLPALNCLQRGQMGVALLYFLLLGFRLIVTGRQPLTWLAGGMILALPVVLKLTPLLPAGCALFLLVVAAATSRAMQPQQPVENGDCPFPTTGFSTTYLHGRQGLSPFATGSQAAWSTAGGLAGVLVFLLILPALLIGWNANLRHLGTWYQKVATKVDDVRTEDFGSDVDGPRNQSLSNAVYRFGNWLAYEFANGPYDRVTGKAHGKMPMDAPLASQALLVVRGLALLALLWVTIRAARSGNRLLSGTAFGLSAAATLVVSPVARGHYFMFLLPAALFFPLWLLEQGRTRLAVRAALIPALLVLAHYTLLDYAGRIGVLGIGTTLWYFGVCARIILPFSAGPAVALNDTPSQMSKVGAPPASAEADSSARVADRKAA